MLNALRVLGRDIIRLLKTPAAMVVVVALVVLPSTYTWFNVVGFWDPYGNTGNMRVCVVNEDAGGENDLMGSMNLGDQIVDKLKDNTQLQWQFTSYDEAMDEVNSGRAYAAFVIPSDFTSNLFTILSGDFQQPNLQYYVNEKVNPVSPKVTDAGSSTLDATINSEFVSTVSEVVADKLNEEISEAKSDLSDANSDAVNQLNRASDAVSNARAKVSGLTDSAKDAQNKTSSAKDQLAQVREDAASVQDQLQQVSDLSGTMQNSIMNFTAIAMPGMSNANLALSQAAANATNSIADATSSLDKAQGTVEAAVERAESVVDVNEAIIDQLQAVYDALPDSVDSNSSGSTSGSTSGTSSSSSSSTSSSASGSSSSGFFSGTGLSFSTSDNSSTDTGSNSDSSNSGSDTSSGSSSSSQTYWDNTSLNNAKTYLKVAITSLTDRNQNLKREMDDFKQLTKDVSASSDQVASAATALSKAAETSINAAGGYQTQLFGTSLPQVSNGLTQISAAATNLKAAISNQSYLVDETSSVIDQLNSTLGTAVDALSQTDTVLASLQKSVSKANTDIAILNASSTISDYMEDGEVSPVKLASFMQSPTTVTTEKLYPLNAYGTAMAPLFISLSLWVGTLMLIVILKLEVDNERIPNLTVMQGYIGRWMLFAILVILQAIVCVAGCLYLGVEVASVPAFFATAIILSLAYLCITYTLSSSLQHIGIGLCIILVFVQIPGGTGLYPIEMTDEFFRTVYPMFPFTYGINALREAIGGFYGNQYAFYVAILALISAVMAVIGLFVRPHLTNFNRLVAKEVEESDLLNVEKALVPERRYRIGQLIRALSDHDEFHEQMKAQADSFMKIYPRLKRIALVVGILVPIVFSVVFTVTPTAKVVILTAWLLWIILVVAFLIVIEYIRDNIERQAAIDKMSDDELREHLGKRGMSILNQTVPAAATGSRITVPLPQMMKIGDPGIFDESAGEGKTGATGATSATGATGETNAADAAGKTDVPGVAQGADLATEAVSVDDADNEASGKGATEGAQKADTEAANETAQKVDTDAADEASGKGASVFTSLINLAKANKPAVFGGPNNAVKNAAKKSTDEDEELLEVEAPRAACDLEVLSDDDLRAILDHRQELRKRKLASVPGIAVADSEDDKGKKSKKASMTANKNDSAATDKADDKAEAKVSKKAKSKDKKQKNSGKKSDKQAAKKASKKKQGGHHA